VQIDKYSSFQLDIEDIARRMREFMSKNAISQSQIGDNVVGLSQASLYIFSKQPRLNIR